MVRRVAQGSAVALVLGLLALLVWKVAHQQTSKLPEQVAQDEKPLAPLWTRKRVDTSGTLSLASLRGKVVVVNFWQSYCAPCTQEARTLAQTARRWAPKGVVFVGIDEQDLRSAALKFVHRFGITYPIVADDLALTGPYGVTGYPETFFIDRHGRVVPPHIVGPATAKTLAEGIERALAE
jgi:cytochrome c biogenesis protein CcmG/thiol:disulfide interchange protein DsbE